MDMNITKLGVSPVMVGRLIVRVGDRNPEWQDIIAGFGQGFVFVRVPRPEGPQVHAYPASALEEASNLTGESVDVLNSIR